MAFNLPVAVNDASADASNKLSQGYTSLLGDRAAVLPDIPSDLLALIASHLDTAADITSFLRCSRSCLQLQHNAELQVAWLLKAGGPAAAVRGACRRGLPAALQILLSRGLLADVDVNAPDSEGLTLLHLACWNGPSERHAEVVEMLLGTKPCTSGPQSHAMGAGGQLQQAHWLFKLDINGADQRGRTPLLYACKLGDAAVVKALLTAEGVDVNIGDPDGVTPLHAACGGSHSAAVQMLLAVQGIRVNTTARSYCSTPLHFACISGHASTIQLLLGMPGVAVNARDADGCTPMFEAARRGRVEAVRLLLQHPGVEVNAENTSQATALLAACSAGHTEVVQLLLATPGIMVNTRDHERSTALHLACKAGHRDVVRLLLRTPGILVNMADAEGLTALHWAALKGFTSVVQLLLGPTGVDVNAATPAPKGLSPLHMAVMHDHVAVAEALLRSSAVRVDARDVWGYTPLHHACQRGSDVLVHMLIQAGCDVEARTLHTCRPLDLVPARRRAAFRKMLLTLPQRSMPQCKVM